MRPHLSLRGACEHNLADLDLDLTLQQWIAVTGPSGSGKTSLVFSTIVAESQRRYLSTLSARARHELGQLRSPSLRSVDGLPVAIAVGQRVVGGNVRSTVGTLTGIADFLRLLFARVAVDPGAVVLQRSHFSFNHPLGACESCSGLGLVDRVDPELLIADPAKSIRDGALVPTLDNGYTVYSQVTLEVMNQICQAHGFDVHTPWRDLTDEQQDVILYGTKALEVPFGKHSIESRMRWKGITARPRQTGYYRGLIPVIEETLARSRNPGVLRFVRSQPCDTCGGTRLSRPGREAAIAGVTLPNLLAEPARALADRVRALGDDPVALALRPSIESRLRRMVRLSLGHLTLDRVSTSLSGGEAQRIRLAAQLTGGLAGLLVALDEPTLGLFPEAGAEMASVLRELVDAGSTLVSVEHDPDMVRYADHLVGIGPGAGPDGGRLVEQGAPPADPLGPPPAPKAQQREGRGTIRLCGARLHNLDDAEIQVRLGALNVVIGPSGAGKSSLVFGTLLPALRGEPGGPFATLTGVEPGRKGVAALDARPLGRTSRSTPATYSGLFELVRARFAATDEAKAAKLKAGHFSFNNKQGRCPTCEGLGVQRVGLHLVADAEIVCATCRGARYDASVLAVRLRGVTIGDVLHMSVAQADRFFADDAPIASLTGALVTLGLGYLELGQPSASLSRGEAQRLRLATLLGKPSAVPTLLFLDEPDRGLHPDDVARLLRALNALVDEGHTVVAISHHRHVWAAADAVTRIDDGRARTVVLQDFERISPPPRASDASTVRNVDALELSGASLHNLRDLDVSIPHDTVTAIAGVSGSGKSSLAFGVIAGEAWHRFAESLPFSVRRFVRQLPRPKLQAVQGLRPAVALRQGQSRAPRRSTVATQSELGPLLRTLWSRAGTPPGDEEALSAEHFSPDRPLGACPACRGLGVQARCDPDRLVTDPDKPLDGGALDGTRPGRFFTEPDGQHMATLRAAAPGHDFSVPWRALSQEAKAAALEGTGDRTVSVQWKFKRGKRTGEHAFESTWDGLRVLVEREAERRAGSKQAAEWAAPLRDEPCLECGGDRLGPAARATRLGTWTLPELLRQPLSEVGTALETVEIVDPGRRAAFDALWPEIEPRLQELDELGLGHLALGRRSQSLSEGERQRVRLAGVLRSGMSRTLVVLDEPAAGLHAHQAGQLMRQLQRLRDAGNTVVVVSHRPELLTAADHLIEMGPGAAAEGGRVVGQGAPNDVLAGDGPTASALRASPQLEPRESAEESVEIEGAHIHNLAGVDVRLPASGFVAITGLSGSGKSSLVFDVLAASAKEGRPVGCDAVRGLDRFDTIRTGRQGPSGNTPITTLGLMTAMQKMFASEADGTLPRQAFSFASPAGRCDACKGTGRQEIAMDILADLVAPCPICEGRRYKPEVLEVRWQGLDVAEFLEIPVAELPALPKALAAGVDALVGVGLGHLGLGRTVRELSGGEAQRLGIAAALAAKPGSKQGRWLLLLDEPARGLHEADILRLREAFESLAARGSLIVAAEHRLSLIASADWVVDLGPGSGPAGGQLVAQGPPASLTTGLTAAALASVP